MEIRCKLYPMLTVTVALPTSTSQIKPIQLTHHTSCMVAMRSSQFHYTPPPTPPPVEPEQSSASQGVFSLTLWNLEFFPSASQGLFFDRASFNFCDGSRVNLTRMFCVFFLAQLLLGELRSGSAKHEMSLSHGTYTDGTGFRGLQ